MSQLSSLPCRAASNAAAKASPVTIATDATKATTGATAKDAMTCRWPPRHGTALERAGSSPWRPARG